MTERTKKKWLTTYKKMLQLGILVLIKLTTIIILTSQNRNVVKTENMHRMKSNAEQWKVEYFVRKKYLH